MVVDIICQKPKNNRAEEILNQNQTRKYFEIMFADFLFVFFI